MLKKVKPQFNIQALSDKQMSAPWVHTGIRCLDMDIGSVKFKIQEVAVICHLVLSEKDHSQTQKAINFDIIKTRQGTTLRCPFGQCRSTFKKTLTHL